MCGRFAQYAPIMLSDRAESLLHELEPDLDLADAINQREPRYNLAPTMYAAVMARDANERLDVKGLRWGLIPSWAKNMKIGVHGINARIETVADKPMFRASFRKRRCIVPMNGYFEWQQQKDGKQPYFIHGGSDQALLCAGIWESWHPREDSSDSAVQTFALLTGSAGIVSGNIHDRQPVILPPDRLEDWLDGSAEVALSVLKNLPEADLAYHPVSREVGSVKHQGPHLVQAI